MFLRNLILTVWQRKIRRVAKLNLPMPVDLMIISIILGGVFYLWLDNLTLIISFLPDTQQLKVLYAISMFVTVILVAITISRALLLSNQNRESIIALPIPAHDWNKPLVQTYYFSQSPPLIGLIFGLGLVALLKLEISVTNLLIIIILTAVSQTLIVITAKNISQICLSLIKNWHKAAVSLGFCLWCVVWLFGLYKYLLTGAEYQRFDRLIFSALVSGLLFTLLSLALTFFIRVKLADEPLILSEDSFIKKPRTIKRRIVHNRQSVSSISAKMLYRDKKFWLINSLNFMLAIFFILLSIKARSLNFNSFILAFIPTLFLIGEASILVELRSRLGSTRNSVYELPFKARQLTTQIYIGGAAVSGLLILLTMLALQWQLFNMINLELLIRLVFTFSVVCLVGLLSGELFYEARHEVGKGIVTGVILFILLWPVLILDGWLKTKTLFVHGFVMTLLSLSLLAFIPWLDEQLRSKESNENAMA